jgi:hypothetical protein
VGQVACERLWRGCCAVPLESCPRACRRCWKALDQIRGAPSTCPARYLGRGSRFANGFHEPAIRAPNAQPLAGARRDGRVLQAAHLTGWDDDSPYATLGAGVRDSSWSVGVGHRWATVLRIVISERHAAGEPPLVVGEFDGEWEFRARPRRRSPLGFSVARTVNPVASTLCASALCHKTIIANAQPRLRSSARSDRR